MKAELEDIARRLQRLAPSHRDPERFHEEKSELVAELRRMAANDNRANRVEVALASVQRRAHL